VLLTLAFPVAAAGPQASAALVAVVLPVPAAAPAVAAMPEPAHPHINEALESMRAPNTTWRGGNTISTVIAQKQSST